MFRSQSLNPWLKSTKSLIEKMEDDEKFSFKRELYAFLNNTVCHCYRHLAQVDRSYVERQEKYFRSFRFISRLAKLSGLCGQSFTWLVPFVSCFSRLRPMKALHLILSSQRSTTRFIRSRTFHFRLSAFAVTTGFPELKLKIMQGNCEFSLKVFYSIISFKFCLEAQKILTDVEKIFSWKK